MSSNFDIRTTTAASAAQWAVGQIHDTQLAAGSQVVFWNELLDLESYRAALVEIARFHSAGAGAMIVHACNPVVWHKLEKEKCVATWIEDLDWRGSRLTARRYVCPPAAFLHWLGKLHPKTPAMSLRRL